MPQLNLSSDSSDNQNVFPSNPNVSSDQSRFQNDQYENPYYLHHNDHPGLILVSDKLTQASDFHSWRRSVWMQLNVRNKLGFINGTIAKPSETSREFGAWSRCNDTVTTWLLNSVSKKIGQSLLFISTAEGIWKNLLTRFKQDDAPRVYDIEQRLTKIEQGSNDVTTYYTELTTLWEEHKNYVDLPVCTCGKCECDAAAKWEKLQQRSRVTKFLMGLNDSYEQSRRHILMLKPIPTIEEAFNIVTQDERQKTVRPTSKIDTVAFQTVATELNDNNMYVAAYNTNRPIQKPICTHCGKIGHTVQKCFKLHGFPPGYKTANQGYRPQFQNQSQPRMQGSQVQPRMQHQSQPQMHPYAANMQKANAIANVYSETSAYAYASEGNNSCASEMMQQSMQPQHTPTVTNGGDTVNLQDLSPQQIQHLISQFNAHVQAQEPAATSTAPNIATVSAHGLMAHTSTSGTFSGLDDWEG